MSLSISHAILRAAFAWKPFRPSRFTDRLESPESVVLKGVKALIEREVEVFRFLIRDREERSDLLDGEIYLDIKSLAARIDTTVDTIRDWVHKRQQNGIPVHKLKTDGLRFPWKPSKSGWLSDIFR